LIIGWLFDRNPITLNIDFKKNSMTYPIKSPRKLIEVALPLDAINAAAALEKQPFTRHHPRSLHIWWARRPFSVARAVIFAQLVNDPGYQCPNYQIMGHCFS
jgi:hypothetical protein